jgi:hypothetical protein
MKQEEGRKIEAPHRKPKRNLEPKIGKILFGMSLLEQVPCFATDKHFVAMNSHRHHVLRRPNLQDLRRLKFTKSNLFRQNTTTKLMCKYTGIAMKGECFRNFLSVMSTFREFSSCPEA